MRKKKSNQEGKTHKKSPSLEGNEAEEERPGIPATGVTLTTNTCRRGRTTGKGGKGKGTKQDAKARRSRGSGSESRRGRAS